MSHAGEFLGAAIVMGWYALVLILYLLVFCALPAAMICGAIALAGRVFARRRGGGAGDEDGLS